MLIWVSLEFVVYFYWILIDFDSHCPVGRWWTLSERTISSSSSLFLSFSSGLMILELSYKMLHLNCGLAWCLVWLSWLWRRLLCNTVLTLFCWRSLCDMVGSSGRLYITRHLFLFHVSWFVEEIEVRCCSSLFLTCAALTVNMVTSYFFAFLSPAPERPSLFLLFKVMTSVPSAEN